MRIKAGYLWIVLFFPAVLICCYGPTTCPMCDPRIMMKEYMTIIAPPFDSTLVSCEVYKVKNGDEFGPLNDYGRHLFRVNRILSADRVEITYDSTLYVYGQSYYDPPAPIIISRQEIRLMEKIVGVNHQYRLSLLE